MVATTAASALASWAHGVTWRDVGAADSRRVVDSLVDTVGVALAGTAHPGFAALVEATGRSGLLCAGPAEVWGTAASVSPGSAALLNATAGHLLDFDDVHYLVHGHPSTVLWPSLIAVAEAEAVPVERILAGYVAGVGVMAAVSHMFGPRHYSLGWHSTSTLGSMGAAAAVAVALGLDEAQVLAAIGGGVSMASGVRANFGTMLKPLHAGMAARAGIEAAFLAAAGMRPSDQALDGPLGGVALFGDGSWPVADSDPIGSVLDVARRGLDGLGIKPYPACRGAHYAIDAALDVYEQLGGALPKTVRVEVPLGAKTALLYDDPKNGLQARFSLPYAVATTLVHGAPTLAHFTDEAVYDSATRKVMALISVVENDSGGDLSSSMEGRYAAVEVETMSGHAASARVDDARGSWSRPLTQSEVDAKFLAAAGTVLASERATALLHALRGVHEVHGVLPLLGVPDRPLGTPVQHSARLS